MDLLDGISVLVTRPAPQAEHLAGAIAAQAGTAIVAPMIVITRLDDELHASAVANRLSDFDMAIFVSRNAAEFGVNLISEKGQSLADMPVFGVGLGTASRLEELGVDHVHRPISEFSSEGLLRLEGLAESEVNKRRIVVFRGAGGREHLAQTLQRRGAEVVYCECYERRKPDVILADVLRANDVKIPDVAIATSIEALDNLAEKIEEEELERLFDMQMLVVGARVGEEVESLGFTNEPLLVENPSDNSIIKRLINWANDEL